jgi:anhydro-N-acetylmuramic acid kinase
VSTFAKKLESEGAIVAGVLSGTSADGIDVALTRMRFERARVADESSEVPRPHLAPPELLHFETLPFEPRLAARVRAVLDGTPTGLREGALLSRDLGRAFGAAARTVADRIGLELDLVGSHGQTVWHHDGVEPDGAATLQLGDGDFVAEEAGCAVVSDFRQRDIAAGGEGAPISALADDLVFARAPRPCAVLNLGGLANLTVLGDGRDDILSFDTGPANSLLDGLARRLYAVPFDRDGAFASRGAPDARLVATLLAHPFLAKAPPKSTGRDTFGEAYVEQFLERAREHAVERREDLLASAVDFLAMSVALALDRFVAPRPGVLVLAGGGTHHRALVAALGRSTRCAVSRSDAYGVPVDGREALVFAVLAARCVLGIAVTAPSATGARAGRTLGKISPATPRQADRVEPGRARPRP